MIEVKHIRPRHDTSANWNAKNPVLKAGEMGWAYDTRDFKIGNGSSPWQALPALKMKVPT